MKNSKSLLRFSLMSFLFALLVGISACSKKSDVPSEGELMIVNASPGFGPVDVYFDNNLFGAAGLVYPSNTGYETVVVGEHNLKVTATGSTTSIFEGKLNTLGDISQSLFIFGKPTSLNVFAVADNFYTPSAGKALIRFFHLSPDGQTIDLGYLTGSTFTPLYIGRSFETNTSAINFSPFAAIDQGTYELDVRISGASISLLSYNVTLTAGKFYTLFLKGISGDPVTPLGLEVITHN